MKKYYLFFCIMFFSAVAGADDADNKFEKGPLYLTWEDSLQDVRFLYPHGLIWPSTAPKSMLTYSVSNSVDISWLGVVPQETRFSFDSKSKLSGIHFLFKSSDGESVSIKCLENFGANFRAKDGKIGKEKFWKINPKLNARLAISTNLPNEWVVLSVLTDRY